MKLCQLGCLCLALLFFLTNAIARDFSILAPSGEVIVPVFDNRSIAMGNTAITTPRGSSAIFSNPSILAMLSKSQLQLGGKLLYGTITNEAANADALYESYEARYAPFPNRSYLTLAMPYRAPNTELKLAFSIGYQRNEGVRWESEAVSLEEEWSAEEGELVDMRIISNNTRRTRGHLSTLTPGVALNLQDRYFFGLTLNRTFGAIIATTEQKRSDHHTKVDSEQEPSAMDVEEKQSALFLRIGALARVTPELSVGLMYRPGFVWSVEEETSTRTSNFSEVSGGYQWQTMTQKTNPALTIPSVWGLGAEYKVSPEFVVALELQSRPFSELVWIGSVDQEVFIDNGLNFSVGAEYLGTAAPMRFGVFREVIPLVDEDDTAPVNLLGLTAGIGSDREANFSWDASVLFGTWEQMNAKGQKYSENLIRAGISVTYRFNTNAGASAIN